MAQQRRKTSSSRTRRTSDKVNDSLLGSHVQRKPSAKGRHAAPEHARGTAGVEFSNSRRKARATRGYIDQVDPATRSGESDAQYTRRAKRRGFAQQIQSKSRGRRFLTAGIIVAVVLVAAIAAGVFAFFSFSDSQLSLKDSNAAEALVPSEEENVSYALCAADLGTARNPGDKIGDAYMVVRIDQANRVLTFVTVPPNIQVKLSDGETHLLSDARAVGGDAELVAKVSELLEVNISHFACTDAAGIKRLVDLVGGVPVTIEIEVDDPYAGTAVLDRGEQTLDANAALTFLRAVNFTDPYGVLARNRALFSVNLADRAISGEGLSFASIISDAASVVDTDWTSSDLIALGDALRPLADATVYACVVPGEVITSQGSAVYKVNEKDLASVMDAVRAGDSPESAEGLIMSLDRSRVKVVVRNGAQVDGAAANMGDILSSMGYNVTGVGNVEDATLYPETLVIYKKSRNETAAKAIVNDLSAGRVVNGGDYYNFNADVLVVIGQDWVSAN